MGREQDHRQRPGGTGVGEGWLEVSAAEQAAKKLKRIAIFLLRGTWLYIGAASMEAYKAVRVKKS